MEEKGRCDEYYGKEKEEGRAEGRREIGREGRGR